MTLYSRTICELSKILRCLRPRRQHSRPSQRRCHSHAAPLPPAWAPSPSFRQSCGQAARSSSSTRFPRPRFAPQRSDHVRKRSVFGARPQSLPGTERVLAPSALTTTVLCVLQNLIAVIGLRSARHMGELHCTAHHPRRPSALGGICKTTHQCSVRAALGPGLAQEGLLLCVLVLVFRIGVLSRLHTC